MSMLYSHLIHGLQQATSLFDSMNAGDSLTLEQVETASQLLKTTLLEADVPLPVVKRLLLQVKERALGQERLDDLSPTDHFVGVLFEVLKEALGQDPSPLVLEAHQPQRPPVVMMVGLQGAGKTTSVAKLALYLKEVEGKHPYLIAADTTRPAAMEQLALLAQKADLSCYVDTTATEMQAVVQAGIQQALAEQATVILVDTAGRTHADTATMADLLLLERQLQPENTLLVLDGMIGQQALNVAQTFSQQIGVTGVVLTKMDADARGGAMLAVRQQTGLPIQFLGVSEQLDGLEAFYPERMAQRLLNMGDVLTLFEKAQRASLDKQQQRLHERMMQGQFNCHDYLQLMQGLRKLGGIGGILSMLPIPFLTDDGKASLSQQQGTTQKQGAVIVKSMTRFEIEHPSTVLETPSRVQRLAKGCGLPTEAVEGFVGQVAQIQSMVGLFSGFGSMFGGNTSEAKATETKENLTHEVSSEEADMTSWFENVFGGGSDATEQDTEASPPSKTDDNDDPLGWGDFFKSMGMDERTPTASTKAKSSKKGGKQSLMQSLFLK
ncbi:MAG: signal recognition particle receptor subunit alpha [Vampirovibrionales bacterium]